MKAITNNKILECTLTEKFISALYDTLLPLIKAKYAGGFVEIHMYEDLLSENMLIDGFWYYPLTVITTEGAVTEWIKWSVDKKRFKDSNPYAYVGEGAPDFSLCAVPNEKREKFKDYLGYFKGVGIKINIEALSREITFLSGRYSQGFVDEMSRQLTERIEELMSCEGLASSQLSLLLAFAPESYFEHTSENVTYRRLLLVDKNSAPRDFWVKWTRLNAAVGFSVSDAVSADTVRFEVGEDVPHKIREKEYRFLLREGREKYQASMGRKSVTEWREIIRRAIKRGELSRVEVKSEEIVFEDDLSAKLKSILGADFIPAPAVEVAASTPAGDDFLKALEKAKALVSENDGDEAPLEIPTVPAVEEAPKETDDDTPFDIFDIGDEIEDGEEIPTLEISLEEPPVLTELKTEEPTLVPPAEKAEQAPAVKAPEAAPQEGKVKVITTYSESPVADEKLRALESKCAELGIRLEYEKQLRARLEGEIAAFRENEARLQREAFEAKKALEEREAEFKSKEEEFKITVARLTAQNEILAKSEEKQKERLASAARDAVERQKELDAQRQLAEAQKKLVEEEHARISQLMAEANEPKPTPVPTSAPTPVQAPAPDTYTYVSKTVKLLFRRPVDPNVTTRIHEIIKATVEYFGKERVKLRIKASVPDSETVILEFMSIPMEEMQLLTSIIQVLGSSGLGIAKAIVE